MSEFSAKPAPAISLFSYSALAGEIDTNVAKECLDARERARLARMHANSRGPEFLYGRYALRSLIAKRCGIEVQNVRLHVGRFGKPELAPGVCPMPVYFNLSHARDLLAVAVSEQAPIGVDIEWTSLRLMETSIALAREYFSPGEVERLADCTPALRAGEFCRLWTLKEAVVKALGLGLSAPIDRIDVAEPAECYRIDMSGYGRPAPVYAWHHGDVMPGLHVAIASADACPAPLIQSFATT